MNTPVLTPHKECVIRVMIASDLIEYIFDCELSSGEIGATLREVVSEIGIDHADRHLVDVTVQRILCNMGAGARCQS